MSKKPNKKCIEQKNKDIDKKSEDNVFYHALKIKNKTKKKMRKRLKK